jgi:hypothetical protein
MTFENTALAIDGTLLGSELIRRGNYAGTSGAQGIVKKADLKVTQLTVPGIGVQIAPGVGLVVNGYQDDPNETYVVSNPGVHIIPSGDMPAADPSAKSWMLAIVIGDPDFSQTGHPWMGSDDPAEGTELTFEYVRPTLIEVSAGATTLSGDYPAICLARIDIPADTTTIINSYIHDLRTLAQPRSEQQIFASAGGTWVNATPVRIPAAEAYADWGPAQYSPTVKVPSWATRAIVVASINGVRLEDTTASVSGAVRTQLGAVSGPSTTFDTSIGGGAVRLNLQTAGTYDVTAIAGTTVALRVEGYENVPTTPAADQRLALQSGSQMIFDVRFFEE